MNGAPIHYQDRGQIGRWFGVSADAVRKWQERYVEGGDYHPFPTPDAIVGDRTPGWLPEREQEIREWKASMPGRGAGGGRPRKPQPE